MAKAKKSVTNSAPIEDENLDVTAQVADAIVQDDPAVDEPADQLETGITQENEGSSEDIEPEKKVDGTDQVELEVKEDQADEADAPKNAKEHVSVAAETHSKQRNKKTKAQPEAIKKPWWQTGLIISGVVLTLIIFIVGAFGQLYKGKPLPNVSVAGMNSTGKSQEDLKTQINQQVKDLDIVLLSGTKKLKPSLKEIGYQVDADKTVENAISAKRAGLLSRFAFWQKTNVPAVITINSTLLAQYLDSKLPNLTDAGQDARLEYSADAGGFIITAQKNGSGPNSVLVKTQLEKTADNLKPTELTVKKTKKPAHITKDKLEELISPANEIIAKSIVLEGSAGTFTASPADIALWITPTPQKDGSVKLIIDKGKVQSYVEALSNQISSEPQDKKVVKDRKTGKQVILQQGRDGTELANRAGLASQITQAINNNQGVTLTMNIKTAKAKTINLEGYDKWVEVDLTKQTTTAYEHATALKTFIIASGLPGYDTPTGEYSIWLKVRSQTMVGGSKADGSYYNLPNVEWVSYFYQDYALHGAYWRKVFGVPGSHGCVNMTNEDAKWVYNWAPVGTKVIVHY